MSVASLLAVLAVCASGAGHALTKPPSTQPAQQSIGGGNVVPVRATILPASVQQGALVIGTTHMAAIVEYAGKTLRVSPSGRFVFAIGRDATGVAIVQIKQPGTAMIAHRIVVTSRDWPIETINGVPPATVNPPPEIAARIAREQSSVAAVRTRDDAREDFAQSFIWPVQGRISGRFGNQRAYNGTHRHLRIAVAVSHRRHRGDRSRRRGELQLPASFAHRREGGRSRRARAGVRGGRRNRACDRAAFALGDELVRRPYRSTAGAGTREVTSSIAVRFYRSRRRVHHCQH
jgi:hypothetical protein